MMTGRWSIATALQEHAVTDGLPVLEAYAAALDEWRRSCVAAGGEPMGDPEVQFIGPSYAPPEAPYGLLYVWGPAVRRDGDAGRSQAYTWNTGETPMRVDGAMLGAGGAAMMPEGHQYNADDQFTAMNSRGDTDRDDGLPDVAAYEGPSVSDQEPLVNPSAGTQGPTESSVGGSDINPQGAAPSAGTGPHSDRQVFPDTTVG